MTANIHNQKGLSIADTFARQKQHVTVLRKEELKHRKERLSRLRRWIHENRTRIHAAAFADFRKAAQEVDAIEIFHVLNEIRAASDHLDAWASPKKVDAPFTMLGTRSHIRYEPRGVCLIISPWNYPFSLAVGPLVSAIAAGNAVMLKPSELTPNVSSLLREMTEALFKPEEVAVFEGGPEVAQKLLSLPFDHIFFTGSPAIGKLVMKAAADHLTSVTLELGGKSPTIVTADADLDDAAERIAVAKFVNNGQTCVAPDYVLVEESVRLELVNRLIRITKARFFATGPSSESADYCRIVNDRHFERLSGLVHDAIERGAKVEWEGPSDKASLFFHPVILTNVAKDARLLEEEIFGPVLPVVGFTKLDDAIAFVNERPKALALYVFARKSGVRERVLTETSAGGVCINDCGIHFLNHHLPFGGVNNSGMGKSHGYYGFQAFSHEKPVLRQRTGLTTLKPFYPPYTAMSRRLMDWFLKLF